MGVSEWIGLAGEGNPDNATMAEVPTADGCLVGNLNCAISRTSIGLVSIMVFFVLLYFFMYCFYIVRALRQLQRKSNVEYRIANIIVRLQVGSLMSHHFRMSMQYSFDVWALSVPAKMSRMEYIADCWSLPYSKNMLPWYKKSCRLRRTPAYWETTVLWLLAFVFFQNLLSQNYSSICLLLLVKQHKLPCKLKNAIHTQ